MINYSEAGLDLNHNATSSGTPISFQSYTPDTNANGAVPTKPQTPLGIGPVWEKCRRTDPADFFQAES